MPRVSFDERQTKAREDGDCCDAVGQGVLTSEVEGWKSSYLNNLVFDGPTSEAQEARARVLQKTGGDGEQQGQSSCVWGYLIVCLRVLLLIDDLKSIHVGIIEPTADRVRFSFL